MQTTNEADTPGSNASEWTHPDNFAPPRETVPITFGAPVPAYTYSSTQATHCAVCGEHKHTPLRVDALGGYMCLACIADKLNAPQQRKVSKWMQRLWRSKAR